MWMLDSVGHHAYRVAHVEVRRDVVLAPELLDVPLHGLLEAEVVEHRRMQQAGLHADAFEGLLGDTQHFLDIADQGRI